jgi:hypothetical protein
MKAMFVLSLVLSSAAYADTRQVLNDPQPLPPHQAGTATPCAAIGFAADGSIYGACRFTTGGNCGRYCQPAKTFYIATWDQNGVNPILGPVCGNLSGGLAGRQTMTYVAPYTAATCSVDFSPNNETVVVDGYTFQYVTTRSDGAELLDLNNGASYLWTP